MRKSAEIYMGLPYARMIWPDIDEGGFVGEILELEGCLTQGETLEEVWKNLDDAMRGWIEAQLDQGRTVPTPRGDDWREPKS